MERKPGSKQRAQWLEQDTESSYFEQQAQSREKYLKTAQAVWLSLLPVTRFLHQGHTS